MDPKEISLHFMLHLNEDFDDDLLSDAIDLLHGWSMILPASFKLFLMNCWETKQFKHIYHNFFDIFI